MYQSWNKIAVSRVDLQLKPTLAGGQSFRWRNVKPDHWIGVFKNLIWILIQEDDFISYRCIGCKATDAPKNGLNLKNKKKDISEIDNEKILTSYFRLDVDLGHYYKIWCESDIHFKKTAPRMMGIRILNQELIENIFSFICSSNNNIKRISSMVEKMSEIYGDFIGEVDGHKYFAFPNFEKLAQPTVESRLRYAGFGYRAKFIYESACAIKHFGGITWLNNLKKLPYKMAKDELMKLPGVGAKVCLLHLCSMVADCICLMSLGHMEAVPVDTHIFKVAGDVYLPHLKKYKNLNDRIYNHIGDYFRSLHGNYAGWANTVLFCADLKRLYSTNKEEEEEDFCSKV